MAPPSTRLNPSQAAVPPAHRAPVAAEAGRAPLLRPAAATGCARRWAFPLARSPRRGQPTRHPHRPFGPGGRRAGQMSRPERRDRPARASAGRSRRMVRTPVYRCGLRLSRSHSAEARLDAPLRLCPGGGCRSAGRAVGASPMPARTRPGSGANRNPPIAGPEPVRPRRGVVLHALVPRIRAAEPAPAFRGLRGRGAALMAGSAGRSGRRSLPPGTSSRRSRQAIASAARGMPILTHSVQKQTPPNRRGWSVGRRCPAGVSRKGAGRIGQGGRRRGQ